MVHVTFQVLEGLERGKVYADLPTPFTIGREDGNLILLNDELVSRFHTKIQEDGDRIILTDLDSTNGTRVNGRPVQMRVLDFGDQVAIGRCLLVFGSRDEIAACKTERCKRQSYSDPERPTGLIGESNSQPLARRAGVEAGPTGSGEIPVAKLFPIGPPELPRGLRPLHQAQISDVLAYVHDRLHTVLQLARERDDQQTGPPQMQVEWLVWQSLLELEMDLAVYLRDVANPSSGA